MAKEIPDTPKGCKSKLLALAAQCADALPDEQASILFEAFDLTNWRSRQRGQLVMYNPEWHAFDKILRAGGFVDAASRIVPTKPFPELRPGEWWWQTDSLGCEAHVAYENHDSGIPEYGGKGQTPALALCQAALLAQADMVID